MMLAAAAIEHCLALGVREFVICAGSRNSPLILQAASAADVPGLRLWHFFEERSAGFFALGRTRDTSRPVAVLTTSGTAAAELLPSVIEAHYQGLPLMVVTADRPRRYRGSGAPQAIEQERLFGVYAEFVDAAVTDDLKAMPRPQRSLHLNVCLEEPDSETPRKMTAPPPGLEAPPTAVDSSEAVGRFLREPSGLLVLLGELLPHERDWVRCLLEQLPGVAVWAEAASGLRQWLADRDGEGGVFLILGGDATLRHLPVRKVLRLGGVPSCRFWRDLESQPEIPVLSLTRSGHRGLARSCDVHPLTSVGIGSIPCGDLRDPFRRQDREMELAALVEAFPGSECAQLRQISRLMPAESGLFLGNSLTIRQWNLAALPHAEQRCQVLRGANGIDGNLSCFFGCHADAPESWAIVGDLTALYDLSAPWVLPQLAAGRRRIVVLNNGGGRIFSRLPSLQGIGAGERTLIENPHALRFAAWAEMWNLSYVRIEAGSQWAAALPECPVVIELLPDAAQSDAFWRQLAVREKEVWG
ncbi:MAG: hypothetical protein KA004_03525 [Verrucomicrobiales bacterium]|nr:hypothetical protein [Verrucomicrobiales bacterium]